MAFRVLQLHGIEASSVVRAYPDVRHLLKAIEKLRQPELDSAQKTRDHTLLPLLSSCLVFNRLGFGQMAFQYLAHLLCILFPDIKFLNVLAANPYLMQQICIVLGSL